jgi:16S rRNA processing protein RimM
MTEQAERFVSVGRILKPHGVRGEVKVDPMTDDPGRFKRLSRVFCLMPDGARQTLHVASARLGGPDTVLVRFAEFETPEAANALRDALIQIPRSESPALPPGRVYYADVVGMVARRRDTGAPVGQVSAIVSAGQDLLEIRTDSGAELLVPWVEALVPEIDADAKTVWIQPVPGLLEP